MFSVTLALLLHGIYLSLRMSDRQGSFPRPLSAKEEQEALARFAQGDMQARNLLVEHNLRLVAHVIKKYYTTVSDQDDLVSIGTIGLIKAISSYRPDKEVKLPTYACKCIQNEIFMHFRRQRRRAGEVSLNEPIEGGNGENPLSMLDVISADDLVLDRMEQAESVQIVRRLVEQCLDPREKEIIIRRYGLAGVSPQPQREIAASMGISRSYVSRLERKALEKLECAYQCAMA